MRERYRVSSSSKHSVSTPISISTSEPTATTTDTDPDWFRSRNLEPPTRYSAEFARHNTVLIGDSPGDIETAFLGGARIIAVAAGGTPVEKLVGADRVLRDLTDAEMLQEMINQLMQPHI
ncbi:MAG: HAD hydrolase-like protein [Nocardia sp.]|nr:HAD hydrolase-like protein [Nocardia sp.]